MSMPQIPRGIPEVARVAEPERDPAERVSDYGEIFGVLPEPTSCASRARAAWTAACRSATTACPLGNLIPDWNDLVRRGDWQRRIDQLHATNNFPEFTGLICPAPCESACVLDIDDDPVMIKQIEYAIVHRAFEEGWVSPAPPETRTGQHGRRDRLGPGRAGRRRRAQPGRPPGHRLRARRGARRADPLRRARREAREVDDRPPRRRCSRRRGSSSTAASTSAATSTPTSSRERHDAVVIAIGSRVERDLEVPGRELDGVHFAMDYLYQRNRWVAALERRRGARAAPGSEITAAGKHVVVIGGGDTGMDCISNANREGARRRRCSTSTPRSRDGRYPDTPWPLAPRRSLTTYALDEGGERRFGHQVIGLEGNGRVAALRGRRVTGELVADAGAGRGQRVRDARRPGPDRDRLHPPRARRPARRARGRPRRPRQRRGADLRDLARRASTPPATPASASR